MSRMLKNTAAVLAGMIMGSGINMALIMLSPQIIQPPAGVDVNSAESMRNAMHLYEPRHFIMPFIAHSLGTAVGALIAYLIAASHKAQVSYFIGGLFLVGGVIASSMIPAPYWFIALDLSVAYLPMAWLGTQIGARWQRRQ